MPFIPDTAEEPSATSGRFIPDAPGVRPSPAAARPEGDESPLTPDEQAHAERLSDFAANAKLTRPQRLSGTVEKFLGAAESVTETVESMALPVAQVRKGIAGIATNLGFFTPDEFQEKVERIDHPAPLLPSVPPQEGGIAAKVGAGAANAIIEFANGMVGSPDAILHLGLATVPSAFRKHLLTSFATIMAVEAPQQLDASIDSMKEGDIQGAAQHITAGSGALVMGRMIGKDAAKVAAPSLPDRAAKSEILAKALDASDLKVPDETGTVPIPREAGPPRPGEVFKSEFPNVSPELQALAPQTAAVVKRTIEVTTAQLRQRMGIPDPESGIRPDTEPTLQIPAAEMTPVEFYDAATRQNAGRVNIKDFAAATQFGHPAVQDGFQSAEWVKAQLKQLRADQQRLRASNEERADFLRRYEKISEAVDRSTGKQTNHKAWAMAKLDEKLSANYDESLITSGTVPGYGTRSGKTAAQLGLDLPERHRQAHLLQIKNALKNRSPVSAEAVNVYKLEVPERYALEGDRYVYKPDSPATKEAPVETKAEVTAEISMPNIADIQAMRKTVQNSRKKLSKMGAWVPPPIRAEIAIKVAEQERKLDAMESSLTEWKRQEREKEIEAGSKFDLEQNEIIGRIQRGEPVTQAELDRFFQPDSGWKQQAMEKGIVSDATAPEMTGMGAAVPAEFAKPGTHVSNMFAAIDADRAAMGKEPMPETRTRTWDQDNTQALAKMNRDPGWVPNLIAEVTANPRPLLSWENAGLVWQRHAWKAEANNALARIARAFEDNRPEDLEAAKLEATRFEEQLDALDRAVGRNGTGSEAGRSLQAQKMAAGEDFTLIEMRLKARAAKGGEPLTDAESKELADLHTKLATADKAAAEAAQAAQTRIATLEIEKALAEARAAGPAYEPRVLAAAEKFAKFMDKKGDDALARIKARLGRTSAGVDPTILSDVGILGAAKLTRGIVDFAKWTDAMTRDLGEWFREHAQEAWDASQKVFASENENFHKGVDKATKEKVNRKLTDLPGRIVDTTASIKNKAAKGEGSPIHSDVRKLVRLLVEEDPNITRDGLIDAIHAVLTESMPGITRLETMDAISGRGKFWTPSQDAVSKTVRDLATQIRLVGHQIDVEAGRPIPRTGYQPEKMTDAARREQQKLNDLKRRHGVVVTDPAAQLGSALAARKTYYTHRIADLQNEISTRERIVKNRSLPPTDPALEALKAEYEQIKAAHEQIFTKPGLTDAQRLKLAIAAAERNEATWNQRLAEAKKGNFDKSHPTQKVTSPELEAIKARSEAIKAELEELRELAFPKKTPDQIALQSLKTRLAREKADLQDRLAKGDFSPRRKTREMPLDTETAAAKAEVLALRQQFGKLLARNRYEKKSRLEKIWIGIKQARGAAVNIASSFDFSAPRQALLAILGNTSRLVTHPVRGAGMLARPFGKMFSAWSSERMAGIIEQKIKDRANSKSGADKMAGIEYTELTSDTFSRYEENAHSILDEWAALPFKTGKLAKTIVTAPVKAASRGVRMSNRAFITFLNSTRAELFDELLRVNFKDSAPTELQLQIVGNMVNVSTGRGKLGPKTASVASEVLWAPKLLASRVQFLTGQPLWSGNLKGSGKARAIVAKEYARIIASGFLLYQVSRLFDDKKETNLTSSDVGKIVRGDTRIDLWGGLQQVTVLGARSATAETTTLKGKTRDIGAARKYGQRGIWYTWMDFGRSKLRPDVAAAVDIITRSDFKGDPTTPGGVAQSLLVPLPMRSVTEIMKAHGFTEAMIIEALGQFGAGVSHYEGKEAQK